MPNCSRRNSCRSSGSTDGQKAMPATTGTTANPNVTRSRLVLEIASEMVGSAASDAVPTYVQPRVVLRHAQGGKTATFFGVSTAEGIFAVASREVDLAIINPAAVLSVAMRGKEHLQATDAGSGDCRHSLLGPVRIRSQARDWLAVPGGHCAPTAKAAHPDARRAGPYPASHVR